jgi:wyosine [tRNA(Phe)-imidazoG37] synthetase (radical SAM superfamily)
MNRAFLRAGCAYRAAIEAVCRRLNSAVPSRPCLEGTAVFGPVVSRRLGYSLGINHITFKTCTYNCVYCQVGRTTRCSIERKAFFDPHDVYAMAKKKMDLLTGQNVSIDYVSFVPNGEPTLDLNLSKEILLLRELGHKIAVITNSSLLWKTEVREAISLADYVSVKLDTVNEDTWKRLNRPHGKLRLARVLNGIIDFTKSYDGILTTETLMVNGINDNAEELEAIGVFLDKLKRSKSYFSIPIRPPAEHYVTSPDNTKLSEISNFIKSEIPSSELLCASEGDDFKGGDEVVEELLGIMSVHPMTKDAVEKFISSKADDPAMLQYMIDNKLIERITFNEKEFYKKHFVPRY